MMMKADGFYLKPVSWHCPGLVEPASQVVEGDQEGFRPEPHYEHGHERERPQGQQDELEHEGLRADRTEHERDVNGGDHIHDVREEDEVGDLVILTCRDWSQNSLASHSIKCGTEIT